MNWKHLTVGVVMVAMALNAFEVDMPKDGVPLPP